MGTLLFTFGILMAGVQLLASRAPHAATTSGSRKTRRASGRADFVKRFHKGTGKGL